MQQKNILLLEDHAATQIWISSMLEDVFPQHTVFNSDSLFGASDLLTTHHFDIAILDTNLADGAGLSVLESVKQNNPETICIMSSMHNDHDNIFLALQSGADGYIIKEDCRHQFKASLQRINSGEAVLSSSVVHIMMKHFHQKNILQNNPNLTSRQNEILTMIAKGMPNKAIAASLGLSVYTIMDHIKRVYGKLNISSRAEAALKAQQLGLVK